MDKINRHRRYNTLVLKNEQKAKVLSEYAKSLPDVPDIMGEEENLDLEACQQIMIPEGEDKMNESVYEDIVDVYNPLTNKPVAKLRMAMSSVFLTESEEDQCFKVILTFQNGKLAIHSEMECAEVSEENIEQPSYLIDKSQMDISTSSEDEEMNIRKDKDEEDQHPCTEIIKKNSAKQSYICPELRVSDLIVEQTLDDTNRIKTTTMLVMIK